MSKETRRKNLAVYIATAPQDDKRAQRLMACLIRRVHARINKKIRRPLQRRDLEFSDLYQEAICHVFRQIGRRKYTGQQPLGRWAAKVGLRRVYSVLRKKKGKPPTPKKFVSLGPSGEIPSQTPDSDGPSTVPPELRDERDPAVDDLAGRESEALRIAVGDLPEAQLEVYQLRLQDQGLADVSASLTRPLSTVRTQSKRGFQALRTHPALAAARARRVLLRGWARLCG